MKLLNGLERSDFCNFEKPPKCTYQKGKIESNEQGRREVSQNNFVEKSGMPDRVKSFGEVNSSKTRSKVQLGFVKPI